MSEIVTKGQNAVPGAHARARVPPRAPDLDEALRSALQTD
jgi:hypothetical protein